MVEYKMKKKLRHKTKKHFKTTVNQNLQVYILLKLFYS